MPASLSSSITSSIRSVRSSLCLLAFSRNSAFTSVLSLLETSEAISSSSNSVTSSSSSPNSLPRPILIKSLAFSRAEDRSPSLALISSSSASSKSCIAYFTAWSSSSSSAEESLSSSLLSSDGPDSESESDSEGGFGGNFAFSAALALDFKPFVLLEDLESSKIRNNTTMMPTKSNLFQEQKLVFLGRSAKGLEASTAMLL
mmetsp:Transcript_10267/g.18679  ORF Transcript_10267/g.18679 Transcript_10267/m.18679 type:complete len:201 (+) Transcript_10267:743-1345(+)